MYALITSLILTKFQENQRSIAMSLLRYKFSSLNFISPLTKNTHMSPYIILGPHKYFSHIIQIFSMILGSHQFFIYKTHINISHIYYPNILHIIGPSQILLTQAYKLPWALSQILLIISHILSNLNSSQINTPHITTKIGPQNYIIPTQNPR